MAEPSGCSVRLLVRALIAVVACLVLSAYDLIVLDAYISEVLDYQPSEVGSLGRPSSTASRVLDNEQPVIDTGPFDAALLDSFWPRASRPRMWEALPWKEGGHEGPPLSAETLDRVFTPPASLENWCPWAQTAAALAANASVSVLVIGGSVTVGSGCVGADVDCRWSRHVSEWLKNTWPAARVTLLNIAKSGMGSYEWSNALIPAHADVIIVDTTVNAFFFGNASLHVNIDRLIWRLLHIRGAHTGGGPPAILYVETFRICSSLGCGACPQAAIRLPEPPMNVTNSTELHRRQWWCPWFWDMGGVESAVVRRYGLPVVSYRDAAWPIRDEPPLTVTLFWHPGPDTSGLHPDEHTHEMIADAVKYALGRLLLPWGMGGPLQGLASPAGTPTLTAVSAAQPGSATQSGKDTAPDDLGVVIAADSGPPLTCSSASGLPAAPLTPEAAASSSCMDHPAALTVGVDDPATFEAAPLRLSQGAWTFGSDQPGKPRAWTGTLPPSGGDPGSPGPSISFPVKFRVVPPKPGNKGVRTVFPQIEITFLRSYAGFAGADISLNVTGCDRLAPTLPEQPNVPVTAEPTLKGWWAQRVSTPYTMTWAASADGTGPDPDRVALSESCAFHLGNHFIYEQDPVFELTVTLRRSAAMPEGASRFKVLRVSTCGIAAYSDHTCC